jgi:hypothetical protein
MASTKNLPGYYFRGDAMYEGTNRDISAMITCYVSELKDEKAKIEIADENGVIVKNFDFDVKKGFNRISWNFDKNPMITAGQINRNGDNMQSGRNRQFRGMGAIVIPGEYTFKISYNGESSSSKITIKNDPRLPAPETDAIKQNLKRADEISTGIKQLNASYQKFYECTSLITKVDELTRKNQVFAESVKDFHGQLKTKYDNIENKLTTRPDGFFAKINSFRILTSATKQLTAEENKTVDESIKAMEEAKKIIEDFLTNDWTGYQKNISNKQVSLEAIIK